jgi:membrane protease YdiL (CAAX protease family)
MASHFFLHFDSLNEYVENFDSTVVLTLVALSVTGLFFQTYWEELFFRGYLLQNIGRKLNNPLVTSMIISILFAFAHLGYGLGSFIHSFLFSWMTILLTYKNQGIEQAVGIHFINNLLLLTFFVDTEAVTQSTFSWAIDWMDLGVYLFCIVIVLGFGGVFPKMGDFQTVFQAEEVDGVKMV